ncbi:hypothetical protein F5877DRAFT_71406 [Lentinula edodes]|nr:hypothetical protein F5877DRAFT_71406 [Lentinula edodes]
MSTIVFVIATVHQQYSNNSKWGFCQLFIHLSHVFAPGPHHSEATSFHPKNFNGSDNSNRSFISCDTPSYCIQPEGERTSDHDIIYSDASVPSYSFDNCIQSEGIQFEDQGSLHCIQPLDAEVNECFKGQLDVSLGSLDESLPNITLEDFTSAVDQNRISNPSSSSECEGLFITSRPGIGSDTSSFLDTPVAFDIPSAPEEHTDVQFDLDDTEFDADDEGVKDDDGDSEMKDESVQPNLDINMADSGNATQTFADHNIFTEVPPTPIYPHARTHEHHLQCAEEFEFCDDAHRRNTQTTSDNNFLGVPLASIRGNTYISGPHETPGDNYQQGTPPLSPLTEIPDTPMVADTLTEDEKCL